MITFLKPGQQIHLNSRAPEWTRGLEFIVQEIRTWGVKCRTQLPNGATAWYKAKWAQIEGIGIE
jgi:hypothetical protein